MQTKINWKNIKHDVNGNPRYVCLYIHLLTEKELYTQNEYIHRQGITKHYAAALARAGKIGGKKFHNKQFRGGIVFQSYNLADTEKAIFEIVERESR